MNARRRYPPAVMTALGFFSGGTCYWGENPSCMEPTIRFVKGRPKTKLDVAHIRALEPGGPRYDDGPPMSDAERNSWANVIVLCRPHHQTIDQDEPDNYDAELLYQWKGRREKDKMSALNGLQNFTEERLQEMITEALEAQNERIEEALGRLEQIDLEAAEILRGMAAQLSEWQDRGPFSPIDSDVAGLLHESANKINPNVADLLITAADRLSGMLNVDTAAQFNAMAERLSSGLIDAATQLDVVANRLTGTLNVDTLAQLDAAANQLRGIVSDLHDALAQGGHCCR